MNAGFNLWIFPCYQPKKYELIRTSAPCLQSYSQITRAAKSNIG